MSEWAPFATRRDGPRDKHGYPGFAEPAPKSGLVGHSMEGSLSAALNELDKPERRASWTFSNPKTGPLLQHYPVGFHTWASGSVIANTRFTSCEHEGVAGQPLTESQKQNLVQLVRWLRETQGWAGLRRQQELWEHREMTRYGAAATACPSGRIPWEEIIQAAEEEIDMATAAELRAEFQKADDDTRRFFAELIRQQQGKIGGHEAAIKFLSEIAVNHEGRIKSLEQ